MLDARRVSSAIVRIVLRNKLIDQGLFCKIAMGVWDPVMGRLAAYAPRSTWAKSGHWAESFGHRPFSFSRAFSNLVLRETYKFNINLCS